MLIFLARRLISSIPILFGVAILIFLLFNVVGGDPAYEIAGKYATPQRLAEIRRELGTDQPLYIQFLQYLKQVVTFDYGYSTHTQQKISSMILAGIGPSLTLVLPAFTASILFAVLIALFVAYHRGSRIDRFTVIACVLGMSVSLLAYILFGQYFLAYKMGWFPVSGWEEGWPERFRYVALPGLLWVAVSLGYDVRFFRTAILEEVGQDYVRTARAKGLPEKRVYLKHVLKNSMVPIATYILTDIPVLILHMFLLEGFFSIPGLGGITIEAIRYSDSPVIRAMATLQAMLLIGANILTDLVYAWVDPRVKLK